MSGPSDSFWDWLGVGLAVFLICAGLGTCGYLANPGNRPNAIAVKP